MGVILFVILVAAFLCVLARALSLPTTRVHLGWLGISLWLLAILIGGIAGETSLRGFNP